MFLIGLVLLLFIAGMSIFIGRIKQVPKESIAWLETDCDTNGGCDD